MVVTTTPRRRTWSALGDLRRVPSEYEIVTHGVNWTAHNDRDSPLEQNPTSPPNLWLVTYCENSPLKVDNWNGFRDPDKLIYRTYVTMQDEQCRMVEGILDEYSDANHDETLSPAWRTALSFLFTPTRFPAHAAQMAEVYFGQIAPSSYITNAAAFAAADFYRRNSLVSYRTRELEQSCPGSGFGLQERSIWETEEAWQPAREAFERVLVAYDWAESFTALNLVLLPTLEDLLLRQVGQAAREHNDELTWLLLSNLEIDAARRDRWSAALVRFALAERAENEGVLRRWIDKWTPRADVAARGIAQMLESLPERGRRADVSVAEARAARQSLLADAGLDFTKG